MADLIGDKEDEETVGGEEDIPTAFSGEAPRFDARKPSTWRKPEGRTWGDHMIQPHTRLNARQRHAAYLTFLGKTNKEIREELNYSAEAVSILQSNPKFIREVERLRNKAFDITVGERLKTMGPLAMDTIEEILEADNDPSIKPNLKADLAKWVAEKLTGKPKQEMEVQGGSLNTFLDLIKEMKTVGSETEGRGGKTLPPGSTEESSIIDVEAKRSTDEDKETPKGDPYASWVDENL